MHDTFIIVKMDYGRFMPLKVDIILDFYTNFFQDTVVALHALSRYGAATFARTETVKVAIQSLGTFSTNFQVENSNRLLLQQVSLPDLPGEYDITVSGEGCVYIQVRLGRN